MQNLGFIRSFQACKQSFCVFACQIRNFFFANSEHLRRLLRDKAYVFRLVCFASERHGSHVRAIGFQKQSVLWHDDKRFEIMLCVFKGYRSAESIVRVEFIKDFHILRRARIAVQQQSVFYILLHIEKDFSSIFVCVANVQRNRQFRLVCKFDLLCESGFLHFPFAQIIVVIKPYFTDCDNLLTFCKFEDALACFIVQRIGIVRMYSDCGIHPFILFAKGNRKLGRGHIVSDAYRAFDPVLVEIAYDSVNVAKQFFVV